MILRFRIEAENRSREELEDELAEWATKFQHMILLEHTDNLCGNWEATDDVVYKNHKNPDTYRGRIVLKFNLLADEHDWRETYSGLVCRACGKSVPKVQGIHGYSMSKPADDEFKQVENFILGAGPFPKLSTDPEEKP